MWKPRFRVAAALGDTSALVPLDSILLVAIVHCVSYGHSVTVHGETVANRIEELWTAYLPVRRWNAAYGSVGAASIGRCARGLSLRRSRQARGQGRGERTRSKRGLRAARARRPPELIALSPIDHCGP